MTDADKTDYCRSYLRREYKDRLSDLKQLARDVFSSATDEVALTSTSFEGGSGGGIFKFDKLILGRAIEDLIVEMDADYVAPSLRSSGVVIQFGGDAWGTGAGMCPR